MKSILRGCALAGLMLLGACASTGESWTGSGEPFGQAETKCRQDAERVPAAEQKRAFEACMETAGWRRT